MTNSKLTPRGPATHQRAPHIALIGCGRWGRNLARILADLRVLRTVCDPNPVVLEGIRVLYPDVDVVPNVDALLEDPAITACVVAAPAMLHFDLARRVLEAGKDVLVEKPLAVTASDGEALVALAARHRRVLMVGHILEYHPAVESLRELVQRGALGDIRYVYATRLNLGRIRTEENALWSFAPHDIHVLLTLMGERPVEVACHGGHYLSATVADVTMSTMRFANGVQAHIFVSWLHPYKEHRLIVVGSEKMAVFDDTLPVDKLQLYPHRVDWVGQVPVAVKAEAEPVPIADTEPLLAECRHFLECLEQRTEPRTDGPSAVRVLEVLEGCQRSLESGGTPVRPALAAAATAEQSYFAHPTATVDPGSDVGEGTRIWHYSHVMSGARIGRDCVLGQNVFVGSDVEIGDRVKIQNNVSVYEGVVIEDDVFCGPSMVFTNVLNPRSHVSRRHEFRPTLLRHGATIGANATLVCGHTVGRYAFVAAGAVVTHDVPDHALAVGVPARISGWVCRCGGRLPFVADGVSEEAVACPDCAQTYRRLGEAVVALDSYVSKVGE